MSQEQVSNANEKNITNSTLGQKISMGIGIIGTGLVAILIVMAFIRKFLG